MDAEPYRGESGPQGGWAPSYQDTTLHIGKTKWGYMRKGDDWANLIGTLCGTWGTTVMPQDADKANCEECIQRKDVLDRTPYAREFYDG